MRNAAGHQFGHAGVLRLGIGLLVRHALVQLGGPAAECTFLFDDQHLVARIRRLDGRRQAGHAAAHNQDALVRGAIRVAGRHRHLLEFGAAHADVVIGHFLAHLVMVRAFGHDPEHTFAQVGACHGHVRKVKGFGLGAARAGADHHMGDAFVLDVVTDGLHPFGAAQHVVAPDQGHLAFAFGHFLQRSKIEHLAQATAGAQVRGKFIVGHLMLPPWLSGKSP